MITSSAPAVAFRASGPAPLDVGQRRETVRPNRRRLGLWVTVRAVQRSIHDAHGEDCTDAAEGDAMPTI